MADTAPLLKDRQQRLLADIAQDYRVGFGGGRLTTSAYDTGWLARVRAPWDSGQLAFPEALDWLLSHQNEMGAWSGPFPHDILPTMSALVALRSVPEDLAPRCAEAAQRAQAYLNASLSNWNIQQYDSVGFEVQLPTLVQALRKLGIELEVPNFNDIIDMMQAKLVRAAGAHLARGQSSLVYSLEALVTSMDHDLLPRLRSPNGHYGHSPAATAAVLQNARWDEQSAIWLRNLQARHDGGVPNVFAIDAFEAAWSLHFLLSADSSLAALSTCSRIVMRLRDGLDAVRGISWATEDYFPQDSDDTGLVIAALRLAGVPVEPLVLLRFEASDCFVCWANERNASVSANAHVLEAFATAPTHQRYRGQIAKATRFLLSVRRPDGSWLDKWHASPYYALFCAVRALALHPDPVVREEVRRSTDWLLKRQAEDGSWGEWGPSTEETAYAVLALTHSPTREASESLKRGQAWLEAHYLDPRPELWIGKQLYSPVRVVEAAILAALSIP